MRMFDDYRPIRKGEEVVCQTLEGWKMHIRADCQFGHPRTAMYEDHMRKMFVCGECGKAVAADRIWLDVPVEYKPTGNPILTGLQELLDYEIVGVIMESGELFIEYPRRGTE